jgi:CYTH domain-containing protein
MQTIELEKTYLVKYLPEGLATFPHKELLDIYIPQNDPHPLLRLRKHGDRHEITRKEKVADDVSEMREHTITITAAQFDALAKVEGKRVHKIRYYYPYYTCHPELVSGSQKKEMPKQVRHDKNNYVVEIDVFLDELAGLVVADVEFPTSEAKAEFTMPDFCLVEATKEDVIAGGKLAGKSYKAIAKELKRLGYKKIRNAASLVS